MKTRYFFTTILFFIQILACTNISDSKEAELKLDIKNQNSNNPKYELVFYENGKEVAKRIFKKGKSILSEGEIPEGIVVEKYNIGNIRNIFSYKDGKRNGKAYSFYKNGKLKKEGIYLDDNPIGITKMYYENGNLMMESKIVNGKNVYYKDYYENGQLKQEVYYKENEIIRNIYDINGQIIND